MFWVNLLSRKMNNVQNLIQAFFTFLKYFLFAFSFCDQSSSHAKSSKFELCKVENRKINILVSSKFHVNFVYLLLCKFIDLHLWKLITNILLKYFKAIQTIHNFTVHQIRKELHVIELQHLNVGKTEIRNFSFLFFYTFESISNSGEHYRKYEEIFPFYISEPFDGVRSNSIKVYWVEISLTFFIYFQFEISFLFLNKWFLECNLNLIYTRCIKWRKWSREEKWG